MASWAKPEVRTPPERQSPTLVPPLIKVEIQSIGPGLPRVEAPEGWVKKVDRAREGKVWVGYFHIWEIGPDGQRVRRKKEKTLGPATKPKHEALKELGEYITEHTGKLAKQGESISTFAELWKAFRAVKSGQWSKKTKENLECLFAKHVIPQIGSLKMRDMTLTPLQLLLNRLAEDGFSKSAVSQIRTYVKGCFEYAVDEDLISKSPARKLVMPKVRKKPCERFLSVEEFRALLSHAAPREHVILRILAVCGLRPAEVLVLRIEDFEGPQLRIDEALKERQSGEDRIGDTKTDESDNFVPVPPDLQREIEAWILVHPNRDDPRAFLFPSSSGSALSVGNYLKRHLKPLAEKAGVGDVTHQAFRRTSSTHIQNHASVKDMQRHLRHTDPQTTLKHYAKVIPESLRAAVAALDEKIMGAPAPSK
ncbi:MAG: tyrosine-type recombinase/integrase [Bryobacteraceae bacterium]